MSSAPDHVTDRSGAVAVLAGLPSMGPRRLRLVLMHHEPGDALDRLASGRPLHHMVQRCGDPATLVALRDQARSASVDRARTACERHGVRVLLHGDALYPEPLRLDPQAPAALFAVGSLDALAARRAGIVGTRNATAAGIATAHELGHDLAALGVSVVSGLARGIDGAAHRGARAADGPGRAVAVVANGADVA
ncbi:MAG: DNA-processing protein DprA, partial [Ilumatobacteraceae bacterium]